MQFELCYAQFLVIVSFCSWDNNENVIQLISSMEGEAAGVIVGLFDDNFGFMCE
jgi:hypothetical protein